MPSQASLQAPTSHSSDEAAAALLKAAVLARNEIAGYAVEGDPIAWRYVLRKLNAAIAKVDGPGLP